MLIVDFLDSLSLPFESFAFFDVRVSAFSSGQRFPVCIFYSRLASVVFAAAAAVM